MKKTTVSLVGAGIGDADMITLRGLDRIRNASCIIYDRLMDARLLDEAPVGCEKIYVGKAAGEHYMKQEEINCLLLERAKQGGSLVRLKGGDPYVFGRGGEEAIFLKEHGFMVEIVPGISSALAGACFAGIPVTHRETARSVHIITAHTKEGGLKNEDYARFAACGGTLVFLMGLSQAGAIAQGLILHGMDSETPAAVISSAGSAAQKTLVSTLGRLGEDVAAAGLSSPAIIVVGETVSLRDELSFFEARSLFGKKILVTRQCECGDELYLELSNAGAEVVSAPMIKIVPRPEALSGVWEEIGSFSDIVFTSANAVKIFMEALRSGGRDLRILHSVRLSAVGSATARALSDFGLCADTVADEFSAAGLLECLKGKLSPDSRVLMPQAALAAPILREGLEKLCAVKTLAIYDTLLPEGAMTAEEFDKRRFDAAVFASPSAVHNFNSVIGIERLKKTGTTVFAIGPATGGALSGYGLEYIESRPSTLEALAETVINYYEGGCK